jgi:hypothetical protein
LRGIDPYIDTVFSSAQMRWFVPELRALRDAASHDEERRLIDEVINLADVCAESPHRTLVFVGD